MYIGYTQLGFRFQPKLDTPLLPARPEVLPDIDSGRYRGWPSATGAFHRYYDQRMRYPLCWFEETPGL